MMPKSNQLFTSKRNNCYYDQDKNCVIKEFQLRESYIIEKQIYHQLLITKDVQIPQLLLADDDHLVLELEYIEGRLVLELLEELENTKPNTNTKREAIDLLTQLIQWLNKFYLELNKDNDTKSFIYGDVNLRNFIMTKNGLVGIDFEQCQDGDTGEELSYLLAMYMMYDPIKSEFKNTVVSRVCELNDISIKEVEGMTQNIIKRRSNKAE